MKVKEQIKNDRSTVQADNLTDLPVTETQARQAKGGDTFSINFTKIKFDYKPQKPDSSLD